MAAPDTHLVPTYSREDADTLIATAAHLGDAPPCPDGVEVHVGLDLDDYDETRIFIVAAQKKTVLHYHVARTLKRMLKGRWGLAADLPDDANAAFDALLHLAALRETFQALESEATERSSHLCSMGTFTVATTPPTPPTEWVDIYRAAGWNTTTPPYGTAVHLACWYDEYSGAIQWITGAYGTADTAEDALIDMGITALLASNDNQAPWHTDGNTPAITFPLRGASLDGAHQAARAYVDNVMGREAFFRFLNEVNTLALPGGMFVGVEEWRITPPPIPVDAPLTVETLRALFDAAEPLTAQPPER